MIRNPDMLVGTMEGKELIKPDWYKAFLFAGTDSKVTQHECLYEGKAAYEKLDSHVIPGQITVYKDTNGGVEHTPISAVHALPPRERLLNHNKIWRYLTFHKFEDLIKSKTLYFARIDQFEDNLEGTCPFSSVRSIMSDREKTEEQKQETFRLYKIRMENNRKVSFACCWHINENINYDMWDAYGANSYESIAIQTTVKRITKVLDDSGLPVLNEPVRYFDEPYFNQNVYWFPTLFKRSKYASEQEYRTILFVHGFDLKGIKIKVTLEELIIKIYIHPKASKEFFKKIMLFIKNNGLRIPISQPKSN